MFDYRLLVKEMQVINDQKEKQWKLRRAKLISCCTTSTVQSQKFSSNTIATRSIVLLKLQINLLSNNYIFHNYLLLHFLKLSLSYLLSFPSHLLHKYQATDWKTIIKKLMRGFHSNISYSASDKNKYPSPSLVFYY